MASLPDLHVAANGTLTLADTIRDALGEEGRPPSRKRVAAWIAGGLVRVEGTAVRDRLFVPEAGARVDLLDTTEAPDGRQDLHARGTPAGTAAVHHLDRHLLVLEVDPPPLVEAASAHVQTALTNALTAAGVKAEPPHAVPPPHPRVGGLVLAALDPRSLAVVERAFAEGRAQVRVAAFVDTLTGADFGRWDVIDGPRGALRVEADVSSAVAAVEDLEARGLAPRSIGRGPPAARPLAARVVSLSLPHPRTGRALHISARETSLPIG